MWNRIENSTKIQISLMLIALIGIILVFLSTSLCGAGISPDSVSYIAAAKNLLAGKGYRDYHTGPFVYWPPLFPTVLAIISLIGIELSDGARIINMFVFGLVIYTAGQLFYKYIKIKSLVILGTISILLSFPLFSISVMVWSEPLFILFLNLSIIYLLRFLEDRRSLLFLLASVFAALVCLQRYMGITVVLTSVLLLGVVPKISLWQRFKYVITLVIVSIPPLAIWLMRNYRLTTTLTGERSSSRHTFGENLIFNLDVLTKWFLPPEIPFWLRIICVFSGVIVLTTAIIFSRYKRMSRIELLGIGSMFIFVLIYTLFLIISSSSALYDRIDNRLLSPIYVFLMLLVFVGLEDISIFLNRFLKGRLSGEFIIVILCSFWLLYPFLCIAENAIDYNKTGVGGYNTIASKKSSLIRYLRGHPLYGIIYSNEPEFLYFHTQIPAQWAPKQVRDIPQFRKYLAWGRVNSYLVFFTNVDKDLHELSFMPEFEEVLTVSDGVVYLIK